MEQIVVNNDRRNITLEYDKERYDIEYVKEQKVFILRRLEDNKVIKIFGDNIGFIVQCDKDEETHFIVTDYAENKNEEPTKTLIHYIDNSWADSLKVENKFKCESISLSRCRITDSSFFVGENRYQKAIYNLSETEAYDNAFKDERITNILGGNTLLVSEKKYADLRNDIYDTIMYGINPETFEITTKIKSEHQGRDIDIYTEEQVAQLQERLSKQGKSVDTKRHSLADITIYYEVEKYLSELAKYIDEPEGPYLDSWKREVNEDFVKSFVKK